jgi:hypothetical protein
LGSAPTKTFGESWLLGLREFFGLWRLAFGGQKYPLGKLAPWLEAESIWVGLLRLENSELATCNLASRAGQSMTESATDGKLFAAGGMSAVSRFEDLCAAGGAAMIVTWSRRS